MNINTLKKFAQEMRRDFMVQVGSRLEFVLTHDDEYLHAHAAEKRTIIEMEKTMGRDALIEEAAYLWFNRLAAFRYMDARGYTSPRVLSPRPGETQPELLSDIKAGKVPVELAHLRERFDGLLSGRIRAVQPEREVYKDALLGTCNAWASAMPWLFAKVEDWAGLLLPQDILSPDSLVARIVAGLSDNDCAQGVEIIGWLYQFYISEKKDEVFAALKKNIKISKENIPAATQLFTPHWIVRFMVENSLGRLWLLNHPESRLRERMKYFVESDPESDFLKVSNPAELKCLDPCCGSGHILAYFFELLYAIYEEEGYAPQEIPSLILEHNIYGIDIDERAAELAAFTLAMVAREKDKRFFERGITPHVIAMRDINVDLRKLDVSLSPALQESLELLKEGRTYGSLIPVPEGASEEIAEVEYALTSLRYNDLFGHAELKDLESAFRILEYLEPRYHVVVTNPPYMNPGVAGLTLKNFVLKRFADSKSDLFAVFMERCLQALKKQGYMGMINQQSWMFLSSYEALRKKLIEEDTIVAMAHLGARAFETIGGEVVQSTMFILNKQPSKEFKGSYIRLVDEKYAGRQQLQTEKAIANPNCGWFFKANQRDFEKIPGSPIAYWVSDNILKTFLFSKVSDYYYSLFGMSCGDGERYYKLWYEINNLDKKWVPLDKGGNFRKWYGNIEFVVNWENNGFKIKTNHKSAVRNEKFFFREHIGWTLVSSGNFSSRYYPKSFIMDTATNYVCKKNIDLKLFLKLSNSIVSEELLKIINPTINFSCGSINNLPYKSFEIDSDIINNISISKSDWDLRETSWDFRRSPLLTDYSAPRVDTVIDENLTDWSWPSAFKRGAAIDLAAQVESFKRHWTRLFVELHRNEEENNRFFIELYGLQDELTPEVPYTEITILQDELVESARREGRIEFDETVIARQFVSYGVGCLMGRYSVDRDGLILADAGSTLDDFRAKVPDASFIPDADAILPLTDEDDFPDDLPTRFKAWLHTISGSHFDDNLRWIEDCLGKDLRAYFIRDFYKDHLRRYKNRPIYWMISSPSGTFRTLLYLHRYTRDTVGKVLNDYLRPYRSKLQQKIRSLGYAIESVSTSQNEKTRTIKRLAQLKKYLDEIDRWEQTALYPTAQARIELDLDDGVKVNYRKLSKILEPVKQLEEKEKD